MHTCSAVHLKFGRYLAIAGLLATLGVVAGCGADDNSNSTSTTTSAASPTKSPGVEKSQVPTSPNASDATAQPHGAATLNSLAPVQRPPQGAKTAHIEGLEGLSTEKLVVTLDNEVGSFWQTVFNANKVQFPPAKQYVITSGSTNTACGSLSESDGPSYCPSDSAIVLPVPWFDKNLVPLGDFAVAYPIAALWGLHIEHVLELDQKFDQDGQALLADCFTGNWAAYVYSRGRLSQGDLEEAAKWWVASNQSEESAKAHATAFLVGFNKGKARSCLSSKASNARLRR